LIAPIDVELKRLLILKAKDIGLTIDKMEIMPDHVHLFVKANPTSAPHWIVQQLKGYTSRILTKRNINCKNTSALTLDKKLLCRNNREYFKKNNIKIYRRTKE